MITINIRDPKHPSELAPAEQWKMTGVITQPVVVLFLHGYNNNFAEARRTTAVLEMYKNGFSSLDLVYVSWPSNARWWNYTSDKKDARDSALTLAKIIKELVVDGRKVSVIGHSMGNYLIAETLKYLMQNELIYWHAISADIAVSDCLKHGTYGQYADRVKNAHFWYSSDDSVVRIISYIRNGFRRRIGGYRLSKGSPENWISCDLRAYSNEEVDHSDCFQMPRMWQKIFSGIAGEKK